MNYYLMFGMAAGVFFGNFVSKMILTNDLKAASCVSTLAAVIFVVLYFTVFYFRGVQ